MTILDSLKEAIFGPEGCDHDFELEKVTHNNQMDPVNCPTRIYNHMKCKKCNARKTVEY